MVDHLFGLALKAIQTPIKFVRLFAKFGNGGLEVEQITAFALFPPKYRKDGKEAA
jgi:hypothetical protein